MSNTDLVHIPANINPGLSPARQITMLSLLGSPRDNYDQACRTITNPRLGPLIVSENVGPFSVRGLQPAIESLKMVMSDVQNEEPTIYRGLGTAGMLCVRFVRNSTTSISNHSWGTAIDLTLENQLDTPGNKLVQVGMVKIAPIFNHHGWYWGAGFSFEDGMHFEVADETIRRWHDEGKFGGSPNSIPEAVLSLGDRGPDVSKLQKLLNKHGTMLVIDGIFGRTTLAAVMDFQARKALTVDGIVGKRTWQALKA